MRILFLFFIFVILNNELKAQATNDLTFDNNNLYITNTFTNKGIGFYQGVKTVDIESSTPQDTYVNVDNLYKIQYNSIYRVRFNGGNWIIMSSIRKDILQDSIQKHFSTISFSVSGGGSGTSDAKESRQIVANNLSQVQIDSITKTNIAIRRLSDSTAKQIVQLDSLIAATKRITGSGASGSDSAFIKDVTKALKDSSIYKKFNDYVSAFKDSIHQLIVKQGGVSDSAYIKRVVDSLTSFNITSAKSQLQQQLLDSLQLYNNTKATVLYQLQT